MTDEQYNNSVDQFSNNVYRFILKNIKDTEKAKDIIQETYEKLWINRKNVDATKVKSYIFSTAYHLFIDYIRRQKKQADFNTVDLKRMSSEDQYFDVQEVLHEAIQKLPSDQRSVILLRDYEGYSYKEISEITGLSESQVKVYIYRARLFLKEYIVRIDVLI